MLIKFELDWQEKKYKNIGKVRVTYTNTTDIKGKKNIMNIFITLYM